jgi:ATP-dependent RNA helicase SUPV3L1/SUV3
LSPEVRKEEAKRFREGTTDILVATDAIAMGLNLPIKTLLFTTDTKFDGISKRKLYPNEVVQIAGRAGRYGHHEVGYIGATNTKELKHIALMMDTPIKTIKPPFKVKATLEQIEMLSTHLSTKSLSKILHFYSKNMKFSGPFKASNISNMIDLSLLIDNKSSLKLADKYILSQAPINTRSPLIKDAYFSFVNSIIKNKQMPYSLTININKLAKTQHDLLVAEDEVKKISLYLWLSYKMPDIFIDVKKVTDLRVKVNKYCEDSLKLNLFAKPRENHFKRRANSSNNDYRSKENKEDKGANYKKRKPKTPYNKDDSNASKKHKINKPKFN